MKSTPLKFSISGHFKMVARSADGAERVLAEFDNLITNGGLDRLGVGLAISHCQVGEGNTAPAFTDSALASVKANTNTRVGTPHISVYNAGPPAYSSSVWQFRFATGVATGNLTEVGVGWASSGSLFSRALILDGSGNPTTITVLADEQLDVFYTLRLYIPGDVVGTVVLDGITYSTLMRPASADTAYWNPYYMTNDRQGAYLAASAQVLYGGNIGASTGLPTGPTAASTVNPTRAAYSASSYYIDYTVKFGIDSNIAAGVRCVAFDLQSSYSSTANRWQIQFEPKVPKTAFQKFELTFRISWARR